MDKYSRLIAALKAKAAEILPKGSCMALYGSRARGDARPDSDWDLHILIPGDERIPIDEYNRYCWAFYETGLFEFGEEVNPCVYTLKSWMKRKFLPFYKNVENDKIILFQN